MSFLIMSMYVTFMSGAMVLKVGSRDPKSPWSISMASVIYLFMYLFDFLTVVEITMHYYQSCYVYVWVFIVITLFYWSSELKMGPNLSKVKRSKTINNEGINYVSLGLIILVVERWNPLSLQ